MCIGFIIGQLPVILTLVILLFTGFSFLKCLILLYFFSILQFAIFNQFASYIFWNKQIPSQRTLTEIKIVDGTITFKERLFHFLLCLFLGAIKIEIIGSSIVISLLLFLGIKIFKFGV